jgi:coenzyme F420-0:L-glutamate ligase / coenzyme F420-1:gamma-L-glutamate ligase
MTTPVTLAALPGIPMIQQDDDLAAIILAAMKRGDIRLEDGDALVITSKIVSKAEGRLVDLRTVKPGAEAVRVAEETGKDPRIVEMVLCESNRISRKKRGVLVTEHRLGFVSANAGIDQSNVSGDDDHILLLPENPDATAEGIRTRLVEETGAKVGIIISDTHGRPFRMGNVGVAIGVAGMPALLDLRGQEDLFGRELRVSTQGYADLVASAAHLVCGEANEGFPVVLVRGLQFDPTDGQASDLNRPAELDLYR